jgi:hypothetical protein
MSDTSRLNTITEYILEKLSEEFGVNLRRQKIRIGKGNLYKEFTGVSPNRDIVLFVCHHSGKTKGGNVPSAKLDGLFAKCYFMEKVQAKEKYIFFTNQEFYEIFSSKSEGITEDINLKVFDDLLIEHRQILDDVLKHASDEMS